LIPQRRDCKSLLHYRYICRDFDRLSSNKMEAIHKEKYHEQDRNVPTLCLTIMIMFMVMTMYKTTTILFTVFSRTETWKGRKPFMAMTHRSHFRKCQMQNSLPLPRSYLLHTWAPVLSQRAETGTVCWALSEATQTIRTMQDTTLGR